MIFDEYDMKRHGKNVYDHTINVYRKDIIENVITNFGKENNIDTSSISDEMTRVITDVRNSYNILNHRYITCISVRIAHDIEPTTYYDKEIGYKLRWYLIHIYR